MTKTTAEVNVGDRVLVEATVSNPEWHRATMLVDVGTTCNVKVNCSDVHSATDYATLQHRCRELEAALAAAAVQVPEEVVDAANRLDKYLEVGELYCLTDVGTVSDFILQLAGKDGGNG